uniref:Uncharacterized protein n=1 Tax=Octopus bimaculoides TaxID=37653 RepID=A0A0L8G7C9_OCTBM
MSSYVEPISWAWPCCGEGGLHVPESPTRRRESGVHNVTLCFTFLSKRKFQFCDLIGRSGWQLYL